MKLIVDRKMMLANVERAELMCSSPVALMFKDFYSDMYDGRFADYYCYSNDPQIEFDVTANIGNKLKTKGKVITNIEDLKKYRDTLDFLYVPFNHLDNREGLSDIQAQRLLKEYGNTDTAYIMLTSGCISEDAPTNEEIEEIYNRFKDLVNGISVGGSYYLQRKLPDCVKEIRIGEYMLFGTIPYCNNRELFGDPALIFQTEVLEVYPERKQILVNGGTSTINAKDSFLLSSNIQYENASCDYTIYNDPFHKYRVGDMVELIPDYHSLKLLRYVAREYSR